MSPVNALICSSRWRVLGTLVLTLWIASSGLLAAQPLPRPLSFERLLDRADLSHNTVFALLQDRHGFLWIGTADGLNRYDGYDIVVYRHDPADSTTLSGNTVRALLEDDQGRLWVGTELGLDLFDPASGRFIRHARTALKDQAFAVVGLLEDPDGPLWINGVTILIHYDPTTGRTQHYPTPGFDDRGGVLLSSLGLDASATLWAGLVTEPDRGQGRLYYYREEDGRPPARMLLPDGWGGNVIVHLGPSGTPWILSQAGLGRLDTATQEASLLMPEIQGHLLYEDRSGRVWAGSGDGLYGYDPATHTVLTARLEGTQTEPLGRSIQTILEDRFGALWVGTLSGLFRYDPQAKAFYLLRHEPNTRNTLSSNTVMAIHEDEERIVWVGTLGGGLNRIDRSRGTITPYRHAPGDPHSLPHDNVWSLYEDERGTLWIGTDGGLCAFDRATTQCTRYPLPEADPPYVNVIREGPDGQLWIGGHTLYRLDTETGMMKRYALVSDDNPENAVHLLNIQALHIAGPDSIWVGSEFVGLGRFDPHTGRFTHYPYATPEGLWGKAVRYIHAERGRPGVLWLGTDMGLVRFDEETGDFLHLLDPAHGTNVYALLQEDTNHLWASTNRGLVRLGLTDPSDDQMRFFGLADGTGNTEFNRRAVFHSASGEAFFGGLGGLTTFYPEKIRDNPYAPPVVITQVFKSNREGTHALHPQAPNPIVLEAQDASFEFVFAALSYTNPDRNRYAYRLDGFDNAWIDAGTTRRARYTNIPPGSYVFRVRGSNNDGVWNDEGASLAVTIRPAFWQTLWFRVLVLGLVLALLTAGYRYRVAHLLAVERMRLRIAGDLHDDIGSRLSSIALMSELVRDQAPLPDAHRAELTRIGQVARQLVESLREIVWFVDPEHDTPKALTAKMQDTATTLLNGTACAFTWPDDVALPATGMEQRRNVFLLYKEAVHNIATHARAQSVAITARRDARGFVLTIADDGVGFETETHGAGHGLKSMHRRAYLLGGRLEVKSRPGHGTTVSLVLPE